SEHGLLPNVSLDNISDDRAGRSPVAPMFGNGDDRNLRVLARRVTDKQPMMAIKVIELFAFFLRDIAKCPNLGGTGFSRNHGDFTSRREIARSARFVHHAVKPFFYGVKNFSGDFNFSSELGLELLDNLTP